MQTTVVCPSVRATTMVLSQHKGNGNAMREFLCHRKMSDVNIAYMCVLCAVCCVYFVRALGLRQCCLVYIARTYFFLHIIRRFHILWFSSVWFLWHSFRTAAVSSQHKNTHTHIRTNRKRSEGSARVDDTT